MNDNAKVKEMIKEAAAEAIKEVIGNKLDKLDIIIEELESYNAITGDDEAEARKALASFKKVEKQLKENPEDQSLIEALKVNEQKMTDAQRKLNDKENIKAKKENIEKIKTFGEAFKLINNHFPSLVDDLGDIKKYGEELMNVDEKDLEENFDKYSDIYRDMQDDLSKEDAESFKNLHNIAYNLEDNKIATGMLAGNEDLKNQFESYALSIANSNNPKVIRALTNLVKNGSAEEFKALLATVK